MIKKFFDIEEQNICFVHFAMSPRRRNKYEDVVAFAYFDRVKPQVQELLFDLIEANSPGSIPEAARIDCMSRAAAESVKASKKRKRHQATVGVHAVPPPALESEEWSDADDFDIPAKLPKPKIIDLSGDD